MFRFSNHPAAISVTEGIRDAWNYMIAIWRGWLPVLVAVALFNAAVATYLATNLNDIVTFNRFTNEYVWASDAGSRLTNLLALVILEGVVTFGAGCYYWGLAIGGLRNRPITLDWVIARGVLILASGLLVAAAMIAAVLALALVIVATAGVGALLVFAWFPILVYIAIRLSFSSLAIFDGAGPIEGLERSWYLSGGAVLRTLGWGLMGVLISFLVGIVGTIAAVPFTSAKFVFGGELVSSLASGFATVLLALMLAVLYESQLARKFPGRYPVDPRWLAAQAWGAPPGAYPPGAYPPGAYPPGSYPPGAYPPGAYQPGAPGAWSSPAGSPPGADPPGAYPPGAYPPGSYPPGAYPPGSYPPGGAPGAWGSPTGSPPGSYPPGSYPPGSPSPAGYPPPPPSPGQVEPGTPPPPPGEGLNTSSESDAPGDGSPPGR